MALTVPVPEIDVQMSPRLRAIAQTGSMKVNFDHGYDSDGEIGPFFDANITEGDQMHNEMPIGEEPVVCPLDDEAPSTTEETVTAEVICYHVNIDEEILLQMKREQLKDELRKRGEK